MYPFVQLNRSSTTIDCWKDILQGNQHPCLSAFAYVTDSGVAQLKMNLETLLVGQRSSRWLFGFDYGRTQPTAVRELARMGLGDIRVYDGEYVISSKGFTPRTSFHLKTSLTFKRDALPHMQIVGSGNLSASGLLGGIEAGGVIDYSKIESHNAQQVVNSLEELWDQSTPFEQIISEYEALYEEVAQPKANVAFEHDVRDAQLFWIDVGYVTKNRGQDRPGNQFDLPRGSHTYLGLPEIEQPELNSVIGELNIRTPSGDLINRTLRFGNNSMEKLTLPIPENYGYQSYDGKYLTFEVRGDEILLNALEQEDFMRVYGSKISSLNEMQSGRAYGTIL